MHQVERTTENIRLPLFLSRGTSSLNSPSLSKSPSHTTVQRSPVCACGGGCPTCRENPIAIGLDQSRSNGNFVDAETNDSLASAALFRRRVRLYRGPGKERKDTEPQKAKPTAAPAVRDRAVCDDKCGTDGGSLGSTECEINLKTGFPGKKVIKEVFDKSPCTRPCVDAHESVHVKHLTPICAEVGKCIDKAKDSKQEDKCIDAYESKLLAKVFETECAAYSAEEKCLEKRKSDKNCATDDGKKRWSTQMNMVKCYKGCFCGE